MLKYGDVSVSRFTEWVLMHFGREDVISYRGKLYHGTGSRMYELKHAIRMHWNTPVEEAEERSNSCKKDVSSFAGISSRELEQILLETLLEEGNVKRAVEWINDPFNSAPLTLFYDAAKPVGFAVSHGHWNQCRRILIVLKKNEGAIMPYLASAYPVRNGYGRHRKKASETAA